MVLGISGKMFACLWAVGSPFGWWIWFRDTVEPMHPDADVATMNSVGRLWRSRTCMMPVSFATEFAYCRCDWVVTSVERRL